MIQYIIDCLALPTWKDLALVQCVKNLLCVMPLLGVVSADIEPISRLRLTGPSYGDEGRCMRIKRLKEFS